MHSSQLEFVRQYVEETFSKLGASSPGSFRETILVRDGNYCGRRFVCDELEAVWFVEEDELKFHGPRGGVKKVAKVRDLVAAKQPRVA